MDLKTFVFVCHLMALATSDEKGVENERQKKLFSMFSIVTFPNDQCTSKSDTTMYGTCYTSTECQNKGGSVDGNCAAGFGVCCMFIKSACSSAVSENCTYIQNPSYPTTYSTTGTCSFTVSPANSDICSLRLDFDNFDIAETTAGVCTDTFAITGNTGRDPSKLCGTLTGQHLYVDNGRSTSTAALTFTIGTGGGGTWKVKVSQIECSNLLRPMPGCAQYFTGSSGSFSSYNWPNVQIQSTDFTYCFRREQGYCAVQYTQARPVASPDTFQLDDTVAAAADKDFAAAFQSTLVILGTSNTAQYHYSGGFFGIDGQTSSGTIIQNRGSFEVNHLVLEGAQTAAVGFKLDYKQIPCQS